MDARVGLVLELAQGARLQLTFWHDGRHGELVRLGVWYKWKVEKCSRVLGAGSFM